MCNDIAAMDDILGHVANMISTEVAGETRASSSSILSPPQGF